MPHDTLAYNPPKTRQIRTCVRSAPMRNLADYVTSAMLAGYVTGRPVRACVKRLCAVFGGKVDEKDVVGVAGNVRWLRYL